MAKRYSVPSPDAPQEALQQVTIEIPDAALVVPIGPSGSGKSTFARSPEFWQ
jgi:ABC-type phosphate transport system ATPase subunit